jgi:predicted Zn-dependent protease
VSVSGADYYELWSLVAHGRPGAPTLAAALLKQHRDKLSVPLVSGLMFMAEGKAREAYGAFSQAITAAPDDARPYLGIAQVLLQLRHADKALAAGQEALKRDPGCWQAALVAADALDAMGQGPRAIEQYRRILAAGVDSPVVHLGLGNALQKLGRLGEAEAEFSCVIAMAPDQVAGYCNLGNALTQMGRHDEAIALYRQALKLGGSIGAMLHANLAKVFFVTGDYAAAEAESRAALALNPDYPDAHGFLAEALLKQGRHAESVPHFEKHGMPESSAKAVEQLYRLGDMAVFAAAQKALHESQPDNIRLAALSVRAVREHGPQYASHFCAEPLKFVGISSLKQTLAPFEEFAEAFLKEAEALDSVWEPPAKTTRGGYQTEGNLFDRQTPAIMRLRRALEDSINAYFAGHAGAPDRYIAQHPKEWSLTGWIVRLRKQGRQDMHIHPDGWLSGVLYLKLPRLTPPEGAIGFSLSGQQVADMQHQPQLGELVLFPSSLFHFTVPFEADEERISVAFDLLPRRT